MHPEKYCYHNLKGVNYREPRDGVRRAGLVKIVMFERQLNEEENVKN